MQWYVKSYKLKSSEACSCDSQAHNQSIDAIAPDTVKQEVQTISSGINSAQICAKAR